MYYSTGKQNFQTKLKSKVKVRSNQYGGVRGLSTESLLVQFWQEVLENLEDYQAGTVITSIDYSKAFFPILLTHEGSHREVYWDFQPSLTSSTGGAKGCSDNKLCAPPA